MVVVMVMVMVIGRSILGLISVSPSPTGPFASRRGRCQRFSSSVRDMITSADMHNSAAELSQLHISTWSGYQLLSR